MEEGNLSDRLELLDTSGEEYESLCYATLDFSPDPSNL